MSTEPDVLFCKICFNNKLNVVFDPCGHFCTCIDCAQNIETCPICRVIIEKKNKNFYCLNLYFFIFESVCFNILKCLVFKEFLRFYNVFYFSKAVKYILWFYEVFSLVIFFNFQYHFKVWSLSSYNLKKVKV